jgi:hypothetical protein
MLQESTKSKGKTVVETGTGETPFKAVRSIVAKK